MLKNKVLTFIDDHEKFHLEKTIELAKIPAPSHQEDKRVEWVKAYFESLGAKDVYVDEAKNVVLPINIEGCNEITVFMAHTDVVFPDLEELPLKIEDGKIYCPGVGDDTANLTSLLVITKYILENQLKPKGGVLIVANSCEEGLGNLKGSRQIMQDYKGRIKEFISFDGTSGGVCNDAVGSHRYEVEVLTEGGHSYGSFGNRNAIAILASMINTLYSMKVPTNGKTTYNVGGIEGGTSVNTIAQNAKMLYEYRSNSVEDLKIMEAYFNGIIEAYKPMAKEINVTVLGKRPCKDGVDENKLLALTNKALQVQVEVLNKPIDQLHIHAGSTDCNTPLSMGVPAICFGVITGKGAHTREEYIDIASLPVGLKLVASFMQDYFEEF